MSTSDRPRGHDDLPVVLCVSEDQSFLNAMRLGLGQAGFVAVATASSAEAFELAGHSDLDALVCDYQLSQTDGVALFERIQAALGDRTPPTLITDERYAAPLLARCLTAGTSGLYAKSEPIESLVERVTSMIRDDIKRARVERAASTRVVQGGVDLLTRIASKEHFVRRLSAESSASYRDGNDMSLLIFEVDRYERIDERHGRPMAEKLLAQVARLVEGELRSRDCVGRLDDHTFGVILPESGPPAAAAVGRRLRATIAASELGDLDRPLAVTISLGAASRRAGMRASPEELIELAQSNCTAATQMGGDRFVADSMLTGRPLAVVVGAAAAETDELVAELERANVEVRLVPDADLAMGILESLPAALIVALHPLPPGDRDILVWSRDRQPASRRVLVTREASPDLLAYAVNRAAVHHVLRSPWKGSDVAEMVDRLIFG
jgi:two-component system cell cycle response regulator